MCRNLEWPLMLELQCYLYTKICPLCEQQESHFWCEVIKDFQKNRTWTAVWAYYSDFSVYVDMGSTWYTSDLHIVTVVICLSYCGTMACISAQKQLVSSVCSQEMTFCFTLVSVAIFLPARCFLRSPQRWKSLGVRSGP